MPNLIATYGYAAVFLLMVAESACIPVPSELIMTFGGALAAGAVPGTSLNLAGVIIAGVAGNVVGSYIAWAVGRYGGQPALRRWGRRLRLREHDLDRANRWFARYGPRAVLIGRVLPVVRTFISLPAGIAGMDATAIRDLHDHRLHSLDGRAGLRRLCRRRQLAVDRQRLPWAHLHHRRGRRDRPGRCRLAVRPEAQGRNRGGRPARERRWPAAVRPDRALRTQTEAPARLPPPDAPPGAPAARPAPGRAAEGRRRGRPLPPL